jgi:polar amino acid transport system substrate-binding protein
MCLSHRDTSTGLRQSWQNTAVLASSFTVVRLQQSINGPEDLTWARVAVVAGKSGEKLLGVHGLRLRSDPFVIQACKALLREEIEAVVQN